MARIQRKAARVVSLEVSHSRSNASSVLSGLPGKLPVVGTNRVDFIEIPDILYCKACSNYTEIYLTNGKKILQSRTLKSTSMVLHVDPFFRRIHQSYLVNLRHVTALLKTDAWLLEIAGSIQLPVSRSSRSAVNIARGL
jgi:two-component system LytT family response regulator